MNFAKKTMSAVLAVIMSVSGMLISTPAFAETKKQHNFVATTAQYETFTRSAVTQSYDAPEKYTGDYDNWYSDWDSAAQKTVYYYYTTHSYYSFTPAETGTYALTVSDTKKYYYNWYTDKESTYTEAPDPSADYSSLETAQVSVYEDKDLKELFSGTGAREYATDYVYDKEDNSIRSKATSKNYVKGYQTFNLIAGKTYYICAYAPCNYKYDYSKEKAEIIWYDGIGSFSISRVDWNAYIEAWDDDFTTKKQIPVDTTNKYVDDYAVKTNSDGSKYIEVEIANPVIKISNYCGKAADVVVPATVNGLPVVSVYGTKNKNITSLTLSEKVKRVDGFSNLEKLSKVTFNEGIERIGSFYDDSALASIAIPNSVKEIESNAFYNCTALSSVSLGNGVKKIGSYAFYNTALKAVTIPSSVKEIGNYAFGYVTDFDNNTVTPYDTTAVLTDGFVICATGNKAAAKYAAQNGIAYYDITNGCPHPYNVATVNATIFAKGMKVYTCPVCGATTTKAIAKKKLAIKSLKAAKSAFTVKVAKHSEAKGYQIQYSTSKKFTKKTTKTVKVKTNKALSKKVTGLKKGKYYVRVRAYKTSGKKTVYSKYSAVKSVKVK